MPKGDIVGMFTGRVCLSLMERTTTMMKIGKQQHCEESGPLDQSPDRRNEHAEEENRSQALDLSTWTNHHWIQR
jgi:hypothetical protein